MRKIFVLFILVLLAFSQFCFIIDVEATQIFTDEFENGNFSAWTGITGSPQVVSSDKYNGTYSCYIDALEGPYKNLGSSYGELYVRVYFKMTSYPGSDYYCLGIIRVGSSTLWNYALHAEAYQDPTDHKTKFSLYHGYYGERNNTNIEVALNQWYCVEVKFSTSSNCKLYIDDVEKASVDAFPLQANRVGVGLGSGLAYQAKGYVDCVVVANTRIGAEETAITIKSKERFDRSSNAGKIRIGMTSYELPDEIKLTPNQEYDLEFEPASNCTFLYWEVSPSENIIVGDKYSNSTTLIVKGTGTLTAVYGFWEATIYHINVNSIQHNDYGLGYPITYIFAVPPTSSNLRAYKRHSATNEWAQLPEKTSNDFFNGIECVRFDYINNRAYVSVAFSNDSDDIYIKITDSSGNIVKNIFLDFAEYYDNRKAVVTTTLDDWDGEHAYAFNTAIPLFQIRQIWCTVDVCTQGYVNNPPPDAEDWAELQAHINNRYVEVASHSRTHDTLPYDDYDSEIGGSKQDIIDNLALPALYKKGEKEYVWAWTEPWGTSDEIVRQKLGTYKYLISRMYYEKEVIGWATWDNAHGTFNRVGITLEMGHENWGAISDVETLNGWFDIAYSAGGIYHLLMHPTGVDWSDGSYALQHLDYIKGKKDVWYVGFGALYAYRYVTTVADLSITPVPPTQYWFVNISSIPASGGVTNPSGVQSVLENSPLFVTATPNIGYEFKEWVFDDTVISNSTEIELPPQETGSYHTLSAIFVTQETYTLTVNVVGAGSVSRNPDKAYYYYGENVTLTAIPEIGWNFSHWSGDLTGSINPQSITVDGNKVVTATFTQNQYTLNVNIVGSGSVAKNPDQETYTYGTSVTLTANPSSGWSFVGWSGDATGTDNPITITMDGNKTITATFAKNTYTLTISIVGSGSVNINNTGPYYYGDIVELTAVPSIGWSFYHWSGDLSGSVNPTTITIDGNKTVTATFTQNTYTLTITILGSGSVDLNNTGPYHYGDVVELTAVPAAGWVFSTWSGDLSGSANPAVLTITGNMTVTATFTQNTYVIVASVEGVGGTITPNGTILVAEGQDITFTITPEPGYRILNVNVDGTYMGPQTSFTFYDVQENHTITAIFAKNEYTLTIIIIGGGKVTVNPNKISYSYGDIVTLTAIPNKNWVFSGWSGDITSTTNPLTITIDRNITIIATFKKK